MKKERGMRKGYTTGANAAAAARAAVTGLATGKVPGEVEALLPNGQRIAFAVHEGRCEERGAHAVCIKDAGDDPDCTDGAHLTADARLLPDSPGKVVIRGGRGIGTITMPGLGLEVGGPAINPVPRRNIEENVREAANALLSKAGVEVTISVPQGEQMAKKTLNDRLGIIGGISILGTTGIVHPYSTAAFRAAVVQGVEVAANQGQDTVVLTTGGRTEKFVMRELAHLAPACFVQMGDFVGPAMQACERTGIRNVVLGGMVGKLTKIAQGETITHAKRKAVDTELLAEIAGACGASAEVCAEIEAAETARFAAEKMEALGLANDFYHALARRTIATLSARHPGLLVSVLVCDFEGNKLAEAKRDD